MAPPVVARESPPSCSPPVALIAAALGSGLIYGLYLVAIAFLPRGLADPARQLFGVLGASVTAAALYAAATLALFALALAAWRAARAAADNPRLRRWALLPPVGFALLLALTRPLTSRDLFYYILAGRVLGVHGANPYRAPPTAFPGDPLLAYTNWGDYTLPYGPLWALLGAGLARLAGGDLLWSVLAFKAVALAGYFAAGALIWSGLRARGRPPLPGTVLWLWNPLVLWEFPGNGHNDVLMIAGMLLGLRLLLADRPRAALLALAAAALVKYVALALIPLALWYLLRPLSGWPARLRQALCLGWPAALLCAAALAPFWAGPGAIGPLKESAEYFASPAHVARIMLEWFLDPTLAGRLVRGGIVALLLAGYARLLRRAGGGRDDLLATATDTLLLLIVLWSFFVPWYVSWALAIAALLDAPRRARPVLLLSLTAPLSYLAQLWVPARWPVSVEFHSALAAAIVFAPYLLLLAPRSGRRRIGTSG